MTKNTHSIQRVFLEIETPSMVTADSIKNNLAMFLKNELFPHLEKQFNQIENIDNQIIQIGKLEISIQSNTSKKDISFSYNEMKNDIKNQAEKEILKALNEFKKTPENGNKSEADWKVISPKDKDIKTLLYFIENGNMPWWISKEDENVFFEKISFETLQNDSFSIPFRKLIHHKKVQKRLINQFSNYEIALLCSEVKQKTDLKNPLLKVLDDQSHNFKTSFWHVFFEIWTDKKYVNLIAFYYENKAFFTSKKLSFELFIQNIKTFAFLDFTDKELQKMKEDYLVSEKAKSIIKPSYLKTNKDIILSEKNTTELEIETNSAKDTLIIKSEENTSELIEKINAEKDESIIKNKEKEPLYPDEKISELMIENASIKEESNIKNEDNILEDDIDFKSCYVQNAGLIILNPFLKEVLKSCELIDDKGDLSNKELAAHLLHYAATKRENDYEHAILFEKFLCGIPLQQSIKRQVKINDFHKQQIEEMLASVVEHWSALKNTSTDVLRSEFLQREGKLDLTESNPKLTIERKTQDLLLEKIPWNISIVKISWIEKLIYTQW